MAETPTTPTEALASTPTEGAALLYPTTPTPVEAAPAAAPPEPPAEGTVSGEVPAVAPTDPAAGTEAGKTLATEAPAEALSLASYDLKVPEGLTVDAALMDKFKAASLEGKVAPAAAQGYLDLYHEALKTAQSSANDAASAQSASWLTETLALPEFTGATKDASLATLGRFMDEYGSNDLKAVLDSTGLGNNPHVVRALLKAAQALDEGRPAPAGAPANPGPNNGKPLLGRTPGQILYPDTNPQ